METAEAELWDWSRILIGEVPPIFLLEVIIRIIVIYVLLVVSMRMMGKRMSSMISRNEMIAMISMAAAVGIPIQDPARGLLPAFIIAGVVVGVQRLVSYYSTKNPRFEAIVVGNTGPLVRNGRLDLNNMKKSKVSRERMLAEFRTMEVTNLGKIERVFMEANGALSIYEYEDEGRIGLCILPDWDKEFLDEMQVIDDSYACGSCGNVQKSEKKPEEQCGHCGDKQWFKAIKS